MRIIAGKFKSRQLKGLPPAGIRPTSDKLRETLFNVLSDRVVDAIFLDGCAGMGAVGIEALSRGAVMVYFADKTRQACRTIRQNLASLGIHENFQILEMDLTKAFDRLIRDRVSVDIAFIDPPYSDERLYETSLQAFSGTPLLTPDGLVILEHSRRVSLPDAVGSMRRIRSLVQGDSALAFYQREAL